MDRRFRRRPRCRLLPSAADFDNFAAGSGERTCAAFRMGISTLFDHHQQPTLVPFYPVKLSATARPTAAKAASRRSGAACVSLIKAATTSGARPGGHRTATSLVAP